jgi:hypothetical protein
MPPSEPEPPLVGPWAKALAQDAPALDLLLTTPLDEGRYGVFSEKRFLARWGSISPRGVRISNALLQQIPPPPVGIAMVPKGIEGVTYREALELRAAELPCHLCHQWIDPLGFAFQGFDDLGEPRTLDNGLPIDTSGTLGLKRRQISFDGPRELGEALANSCDAHVGLADGFLKAALAIYPGLTGASDWTAQEIFDDNHLRLEQAFVRSSSRSYADLVRAWAQSPIVLRP